MTHQHVDCRSLAFISTQSNTPIHSSNCNVTYQEVKEFHMLARIGCGNFMVFSPFKVNVTYYHPLNQWLLGATNGNQGQTVMHHQSSETINHL